MRNSAMVAAFHRAVGDRYPDTPTAPSAELLDLRERLIDEEFTEAIAEFDRLRGRVAVGDDLTADDLAPLAHELVDLLYVTYGALAALGVPTDAVFAEVHRANMAKAAGPRRADGKQLKPDGWTAPDVGTVLRARQPFDPSTLPTKLVGAGLLIRDRRGAVLLVKPTYKPGWEIPGGLVEPDESPQEAARRECLEELGRDVAVGDLLCIHYASGSRTPRDGVMFVFDGGVSTTAADDFELPADELNDARFVAPEDLDGHLPPGLVGRLRAVRRLRAAHDATGTGAIAYLER